MGNKGVACEKDRSSDDCKKEREAELKRELAKMSKEEKDALANDGYKLGVINNSYKDHQDNWYYEWVIEKVDIPGHPKTIERNAERVARDAERQQEREEYKKKRVDDDYNVSILNYRKQQDEINKQLQECVRKLNETGKYTVTPKPSEGGRRRLRNTKRRHKKAKKTRRR